MAWAWRCEAAIFASPVGQGIAVEEGADEVTLQFRKTKSDQLALGDQKTTLRSTGVRHLCPVQALQQMRSAWPQRFVWAIYCLCFAGRREASSSASRSSTSCRNPQWAWDYPTAGPVHESFASHWWCKRFVSSDLGHRNGQAVFVRCPSLLEARREGCRLVDSNDHGDYHL